MIRNSENDKEKICTDLKNCGCTSKEIETYLKLEQTGQCQRFLEKKRNGLLDKIHTMENHIRTVDYLIYQMKNEGEGKDEDKNGNH